MSLSLGSSKGSSNRDRAKRSKLNCQYRLWAAIESLEPRQLLSSAPATFDQGTVLPINPVSAITGAILPVDRPFGEVFVSTLNATNTGPKDIVFLGGDGLSVIMGNGDGTFKPNTEVFPVGAVTGNPNIYDDAIEADVNGDGIPDFVVVESPATPITGPNGAPGVVTVFLGNGNGTFKTEVYSNVGNNPSVVAVAPLQINGKKDRSGNYAQDIIVSDLYNRRITILSGNGDGTFAKATANSPYTSVPVGNEPTAITSLDINGDGIPDLVVFNSTDKTMSVLLNNKGGVFKPQFVLPARGPVKVVTTLANAPGTATLVTVGGGTNNYGLGSFIFFSSGVNVYSNTTPVDGNKPYLARAYSIPVYGSEFNPSQGDSFSVDYDDATVTIQQNYVTTNIFSGLTSLNSQTYSTLGVYTSKANGTSILGYGPDGATSGDLINGDENPDIVVTDNGLVPGVILGETASRPPAITIIVGASNGTFEAEKQPGTASGLGVDQGGYPNSATVAGSNQYNQAIAVGDLNGDGAPDLVTTSYGGPVTPGTPGMGGMTPTYGTPPTVSNYSGSINVLLNNGIGTFAPIINHHYGTPVEPVLPGNSNSYGPDAATIATLEGDGSPALIVGTHYNLEPTMLSKNIPGVYMMGYNSMGVNHPAVNIPGMNVPETYGPGPNLFILKGTGNGTFTAPNSTMNLPLGVNSTTNMPMYANVAAVGSGAYYSGARGVVATSVADVNGDGVPDIVIDSYGSAYRNKNYPGTAGAISVMLGKANGTFEAPQNLNLSYTLINRGKLHTYHLATYGPTDMLVTQLGNTFSQNGKTYEAQDIVFSVSAKDIEGQLDANMDGKGVPLPASFTDAVFVMLGTGTGTFSAPVRVPTGYGASQIVAGHFNGPNKPLGLAVLNHKVDSLTILGGNPQTGAGANPELGNGTFFVQQIYDFPFLPDTPVNPPPGVTPLPRETDSVPVSIAVGDINGDGFDDVVVSYAGTDKYPGYSHKAYAGQYGGGGKVAVLLNEGLQADGLGFLGPATQFAATNLATIKAVPNQNTNKNVASIPVNVLVADVHNNTGQGLPDVILLDSTNAKYSGAVSVLLNSTPEIPTITNLSSTTFTTGTAGTFTFTTTGSPTPSLTETGALPAGVTFKDLGNGTATLAGDPGATAGGLYTLTIDAGNGNLPDAIQVFTLTVDQPAAVTSVNHATFGTGILSNFLVTTSGFPAATGLTVTGAPADLTKAAGPNGTFTLSETPISSDIGTYNITLTPINGIGGAVAQMFTLIVTAATAPEFVSPPTSATFTAGTAATPVTFTTTGIPQAHLSESSTPALPSNITFVDNGNGTATLSGTPTVPEGGVYHLTITAANGVSPPATLDFTLTINQGIVFTSAAGTTFTSGTAGSDVITTSGFPTATLTEVGAPAGVTFVDNGNGTGTLSSTTAAVVGGVYTLTITAANSASSSATQVFTLTIDQAPAFTSASNAIFAGGLSLPFTITTSNSEFPAPAITESGPLPGGLTLTDNGNGTATISGTPASNTQGVYIFTLTANNGVSPSATQVFTLTVVPGAVITNIGGTVNVTGTPQPDTASIRINGQGNVVVIIDAVKASFPFNSVSVIDVSLGAGNDSISIAAGVPAVFVNGGGGNDTIVAANAAADTLGGGAGNDSIIGGASGEMLLGNAGNDTLVAGPGNETLTGGAGNDSITGGPGNDLLNGGADNDTLIAGTGFNTLNGGAGDDSLIGGAGHALLLGGTGDTIMQGPNDTVMAVDGTPVILQ